MEGKSLQQLDDRRGEGTGREYKWRGNVYSRQQLVCMYKNNTVYHGLHQPCVNGNWSSQRDREI